MPLFMLTKPTRRRKRPLPPQQEMRYGPRTHGGKRANAGRPPLKQRKSVPRRTRPDFNPRHPVHITLRLLPAAAGLRKRSLYREIRAVMRHVQGEGFRICHYTIEGNHLHLVCEANGKQALAAGVQVFCSMMARRINRVRGYKGRVFADRYHQRVLSTPAEVRNALCYVLNNWRHHRHDQAWQFDPFSSGALFDGWSDATAEDQPRWLDPDEPIPIALPRWWLLREGWQRGGGRISTRTVPG